MHRIPLQMLRPLALVIAGLFTVGAVCADKPAWAGDRQDK